MLLDKSLPRFLIALEKPDGFRYPRYELPKGYTAHLYEEGKGYEDAFARMEVACGQMVDFQTGLDTFRRNFLENPAFPDLDPRQRCLFVRAPGGQIMATCSMWMGTDLSATPRPRMHWLIVGDGHEGKGVARALVTKMLDLHASLNEGEYLYLNTATWNYQAIGIYLGFGFVPYAGKKPLSSPFVKMTEEEWRKQDQAAWDGVMGKINEYRKNKAERS